MRKILISFGRMTALTARVASPFLHLIEPGTSRMAPTNGQDLRNPDARPPQTNREFADAALRASRTLW